MKKHIFITALFCFISVTTPAWAANKYLHASAGTGSWSDATGTWRTTDQGATVAAACTSADVCYATANAGARTLTIDGANAASQLILTGFTGTLESSSAANTLTVTTTITIPASVNFGATAFKLVEGTGTSTITIVPTFPWDFQFGATGTKTLGSNITIGGITYLAASPTINGNTWCAVGGIESTSTTNRVWYGSTIVEIQGGRWYYITKRTGGKIVLNGNVTLESGYATLTMGIYDSTLSYTSGTISVVADSIFNVNGTSTIESNVGSNVIFENIDFSGTLTLGCDLYVAHSISSIGTSSQTINGAYTIHVGYGGGSGANVIMYNLGTFISSDAKISMEGTGTIFEDTSYNNMSFSPLSALQIDVDINSTGTVTFNKENSTINRFGNGRTLTYVAGTVVTTGCVWQVTTGGYNFNIDTLVPTFDVITTGVSATFLSDFDVTTLRKIGGANIYIGAGKTLTVSTNMYYNGTDSTTSITGAYAEISPFVGTSTAVQSGTFPTVQGGLQPTTGNSVQMNGGSGTFNNVVNLGATYTIAFTCKAPTVNNASIFYKDSAFYLGFISAMGGGKLYMTTATAGSRYWAGSIQTSASLSLTHRYVVTKASGDAYGNIYIDRVLSNGTKGLTCAGLSFDGVTSMGGDLQLDELITTHTAWTQADVDADFLQVATNNTAYAASDLSGTITNGWHFDETTFSGNLIYNGTSLQIFKETFQNLTATTPIYSWYGTSTNNTNIYAITRDNIKPYAVATA